MPNTLYVYKISFKKMLSTYSTISELDLDKISNLDISNSFGYEIDGLYYYYIITNKIEMKKYINILEKNLISFDWIDVSEKIIKNEHDLSYINKYLTPGDEYIFDIFCEDIDKWIYDKLELDDILDMISLNGIDSLRKIDKKFLKQNYSE